MAEKKRLANIELLKNVNMLMVVGIHYIRESGSLLTVQTQTLTAKHALAMLLEVLFIVMIDAYVFISGYYGIDGKFKPSKLIGFLCRLWFYTLLIPIVLSLFGVATLVQTEGIYGLLKYIFPIGNEHYWFMTAYFYLMLFMPFINLAVKTLEKKQMLVIVTCFLIVFCGVKSVVPLPFALDKGGYELIWLICVYMLAACMRLYGGRLEQWCMKHGLKLYLISALMSWMLILLAWKLSASYEGLRYFFGVPLHHNFILCLIGAIGLFYTFFSMKIKDGKVADVIRKLSAYSLGVYLLHEHLDVRTRWCPALTNWMKPALGDGVVFFVVGLLFCVVVIFVAGVSIDLIRQKIFDAIYRLIKNTKLVERIKSLDNLFAKKEG